MSDEPKTSSPAETGEGEHWPGDAGIGQLKATSHPEPAGRTLVEQFRSTPEGERQFQQAQAEYLAEESAERGESLKHRG